MTPDFGDESNKKAKLKEEKNPEEKKKNIKALIDKIPTDKDALFSYEIDWEMVDPVRIVYYLYFLACFALLATHSDIILIGII